jgi:hypothetical protein
MQFGPYRLTGACAVDVSVMLMAGFILEQDRVLERQLANFSLPTIGALVQS